MTPEEANQLVQGVFDGIFRFIDQGGTWRAPAYGVIDHRAIADEARFSNPVIVVSQSLDAWQ